MSVIQRIKELREEMEPIANNFRSIHLKEGVWRVQELVKVLEEHEALLRFVERVKGMDRPDRSAAYKAWGTSDGYISDAENGIAASRALEVNDANRAWREQRDAALTQLDKELKG